MGSAGSRAKALGPTRSATSVHNSPGGAEGAMGGERGERGAVEAWVTAARELQNREGIKIRVVGRGTGASAGVRGGGKMVAQAGLTMGPEPFPTAALVLLGKGGGGRATTGWQGDHHLQIESPGKIRGLNHYCKKYTPPSKAPHPRPASTSNHS